MSCFSTNKEISRIISQMVGFVLENKNLPLAKANCQHLYDKRKLNKFCRANLALQKYPVVASSHAERDR